MRVLRFGTTLQSLRGKRPPREGAGPLPVLLPHRGPLPPLIPARAWAGGRRRDLAYERRKEGSTSMSTPTRFSEREDRTGLGDNSMKAIVRDEYGPRDVLELREIGRPGIGDDEVLVR